MQRESFMILSTEYFHGLLILKKRLQSLFLSWVTQIFLDYINIFEIG